MGDALILASTATAVVGAGEWVVGDGDFAAVHEAHVPGTTEAGAPRRERGPVPREAS